MYAALFVHFTNFMDADTPSCRVKPIVFSISPGLHSSFTSSADDDETRVAPVAPPPIRLPSGWVKHLHPEGAAYYVNSLLSLVTDSSIFRPEIFASLMKAHGIVQTLATHHGFTFTPDTDLYIRCDEPKTCYYYLVDHDRQVEFWLNELATDELNFHRAISTEHLSKHCTPSFCISAT